MPLLLPLLLLLFAACVNGETTNILIKMRRAVKLERGRICCTLLLWRSRALYCGIFHYIFNCRANNAAPCCAECMLYESRSVLAFHQFAHIQYVMEEHTGARTCGCTSMRFDVHHVLYLYEPHPYRCAAFHLTSDGRTALFTTHATCACLLQCHTSNA